MPCSLFENGSGMLLAESFFSLFALYKILKFVIMDFNDKKERFTC